MYICYKPNWPAKGGPNPFHHKISWAGSTSCPNGLVGQLVMVEAWTTNWTTSVLVQIIVSRDLIESQVIKDDPIR